MPCFAPPDARVGADRNRHPGRVEIADIFLGKAIFADPEARRGIILAPRPHLVGLQLIDGERRRVEGSRLLDPGDRFGVEHTVLDAVRDHVDPGVGRKLAALDGHRVGQHALAMLVRLVGERGERLDIHRAFLGQLSVTPAVGERLDIIGLVRLQRLHFAPGALGGCHPFGGIGVAPVGPVAAGRTHTRDEIDVRRVNVGEPGTTRRERLGLLMKIVHRRDATREIGVGDLRERAGRTRRRPVRVDVDEARQQGLAVGADDLCPLRHLDVGADRLDAAVAHHDGAAIGILAGRIKDRRAGDRDHLAARFGKHRLARPAQTGGNRRCGYEHLPKTSHAHLLDCPIDPALL